MQTIIHAHSLSAKEKESIRATFAGELIQRQGYFVVGHSKPVDTNQLADLRSQSRFDINPLPQGYDAARVRLLVTDMDSTLIAIECIDEIADRLRIKPRVAAITEAAMQGEIDFETALKQRVALLKDLPEADLQWVYEYRLRLNPGAQHMLTAVSAAGIKTALVSGGFTFFTDRLKQCLPIDFSLANILETENGALTGGLTGKLIGADAKADFLLALCDELKIEPSQAIAIGDGANDVKMLKASGLGVAYRAKPSVRLAADVQLNCSGLQSICDLLLL